MSDTPYHLFYANPLYPGGARENFITAAHVLTEDTGFRHITMCEVKVSLLAHCFNNLWVRALNMRKNGVTHFLMLHSDVIPTTENWLRVLLTEMERTEAQVLSAVLPIKDGSGFTSTALDTDRWNPKRLTLEEVRQEAVTFTKPNLLINTGLLLIDLRSDWVEKIFFTVNDLIEKNADGEFVTFCESEDWYFSRKLHELGVYPWATSSVEAIHQGSYGYLNTIK